MKENKELILNFLLHALWHTRAGEDVIDLQLLPDERYVKITFLNSGIRTYSTHVCIEADSGIAMIMDICKALM